MSSLVRAHEERGSVSHRSNNSGSGRAESCNPFAVLEAKKSKSKAGNPSASSMNQQLPTANGGNSNAPSGSNPEEGRKLTKKQRRKRNKRKRKLQEKADVRAGGAATGQGGQAQQRGAHVQQDHVRQGAHGFAQQGDARQDSYAQQGDARRSGYAHQGGWHDGGRNPPWNKKPKCSW